MVLKEYQQIYLKKSNFEEIQFHSYTPNLHKIYEVSIEEIQ